MWARTGIASMRDAGLAGLPEELWEVAHSIRVSFHPSAQLSRALLHPGAWLPVDITKQPW